jgi:hypothetical protein
LVAYFFLLNRKSNNPTDQLQYGYCQVPNGLYYGQNYTSVPQGCGFFLSDWGDCYFGGWENGKMNGPGVIFMAFGGYIETYFLDGKADGKGLVYFPNGDFVEGFFLQGKRQNECLKFCQSKNQWRLRFFEDGKPIRLLEEGDGRPISFRKLISAFNLIFFF